MRIIIYILHLSMQVCVCVLYVLIYLHSCVLALNIRRLQIHWFIIKSIVICLMAISRGMPHFQTNP